MLLSTHCLPRPGSGDPFVLLVQAYARVQQLQLCNTTFQAADIEHVDSGSGCFDAVLCSASLPYLEDLKTVAQKFNKWLRRGGKLIFNSPQVPHQLVQHSSLATHHDNVKETAQASQ